MDSHCFWLVVVYPPRPEKYVCSSIGMMRFPTEWENKIDVNQTTNQVLLVIEVVDPPSIWRTLSHKHVGHVYMEVSIVMGVPQKRWMVDFMENPIVRNALNGWLTWGYPHDELETPIYPITISLCFILLESPPVGEIWNPCCISYGQFPSIVVVSPWGIPMIEI